MINNEIWEKSISSSLINLDTFSKEIQDCILSNGDGVADHYGGRAPYVFLEKKDNKILVAELALQDDNQVKIFQVINCTGGYGVDLLGHKLLDLEGSIISALHECPSANDEYHSHDRHQLVKSILKLIGNHTKSNPNDWEITFTSTGTEAIDLAMQIAMLDGYNILNNTHEKEEKDILIACYGAWHGWGLNSNQLINRRQFTGGLPRINNLEVVYMQYGDINSLESIFKIHSGKIRSTFVEGILGDGGILIASDDWWNKLFELSGIENSTIINDEVFTGFRCGNVLAIPEGLKPDCITLGKGLGFGLFPISAVIWKKSKFNLRPGIGVRTFNARPFQARIIIEALRIIESNSLFEKNRTLGSKFLGQLFIIMKEYPEIIKSVRGKGFLFGLELNDKYARKGHIIRNLFLSHGVLTEVESGIFGRNIKKEYRINETIRIAPPLTMEKEELDIVISNICKAMINISHLNNPDKE